MASTPTNHWKLGLFVVSGASLGLAAVLVLGARSFHKHTVEYESYFDESVQGLDIGSPVKFRGVAIGSVSRIRVAADRRHVEVTSALVVDEIKVMGIASGQGENSKTTVPPDLRVQLATAGITGVKFLQLDIFPGDRSPPPLPFPVQENYIPSKVSTIKSLEDALIDAFDRLPVVTDAAVHVIGKVERLLDEFEKRHLVERAEKTIVTIDGAFARVGGTLAQIDAGRLSRTAEGTLEHLDGAAMRLNAILNRIDGDHGVIASAERASDAVGDAVSNVSGLGDDLSSTLRGVERAAESMRRLADALERDSDMLVKGRARPIR